MVQREFDGQVALVTGGGSGIGRATALAFAQQGARVVVADVAVPEAEKTVKLIKDSGGEAMFVRANVAVAAEVQAMVAKTLEAYGRLDAACNNAGIEGTTAPTADYPEETWRRVLDVNLTGIWLCMKSEIPVMLKQRLGAIVNMSSILGTVGFANASAYVASKHGIIGLTQTAALEYAAQGIRVNAICPAFIQTPLIERGGVYPGSEMHQFLVRAHPIGRLGTPEEVAHAVIWLCSGAASFVTGQAMLVDGGYTAQ